MHLLYPALNMFVNKSSFVKRSFKCVISNITRYASSAGIDTANEDFVKESNKLLYEGHIPTTVLQKVLLTVGSSVASITDPYRHDMVAVLSETTGCFAAKKIREKMLKDPEGSQILIEKPRISSSTLDFPLLQTLPEGTLGHAYLCFLKDNNVTPDSRRPVQFIDDAELAYVIQRYREVHDLQHTLLGMPTNMLGEVAVKWVEAIQTGIPMCTAAAIFGPLRFKTLQRQKYLKSYLPWAIDCGFRAKFLMNVYFEKRWEQNIKDIREELNIPPFTVSS
ncbi:ubiquinone biosynthesis protein COQ4 homolog, mitochondrial-like isoform X2 [Stegodyphus dumicola]|uniref:ubiquinone biosynthesis protein COQ4 homolog, mitochondrial-like isoform X2 n=1 Tax=Stegodyphus dumicola TaxID=202533 RepID=UPI0015AE9DFC|nr:ubiquinone biosynthesis protein COQ4 homolog, mitochondrial-like isoform X2 [Stegodyphus dumicola]